jgi:hypothetical protein
MDVCLLDHVLVCVSVCVRTVGEQGLTSRVMKKKKKDHKVLSRVKEEEAMGTDRETASQSILLGADGHGWLETTGR